MIRKLFLQPLEQKRLLAADVGLADDGQLQITGDAAAEVVSVSRDEGEIVVDADGSISRFPASDVSKLSFEGGDGDDHFTNNTDLPSIAYGNDGNDTLIGGSNDDELRGGDGDDVLVGRDGDDELHGDYGNDSLSGGDGNDDLRGWYGDDALDGGDGDDYLSGYKGDDVAWGGKGDDLIRGHEGNDWLFGESGNDRIYGYKGDDVIDGGSGDDYLSGWSGDDILVGGKGDDYLRGHSGEDLLIGGKGTDRMDGGSGEDLVISAWTRDDGNFDALDKLMQSWHVHNESDAAVDTLMEFINRRVQYNDGKADEFLDNRDELDWFVLDRKDFFTDI